MGIHGDKRWCKGCQNGGLIDVGVSEIAGIPLFIAQNAMICSLSFAFSLFLPIFTPNCIYGAEAPNQ